MKLSLTGGSGMPIQTLLDCPCRFKHILEGWRNKKQKPYFAEGSIFHKEAAKIIQGEGARSVEDLNNITKDLSEAMVFDEKRDKWLQIDGLDPCPGCKKLCHVSTSGEVEKEDKKCRVTEADKMKRRLYHSLFQVHLNRDRFKGISGIERYVETDLLVNPTDKAPGDTQKALQDAGLIFCGRIDLDYPQRVDDLKTASPSRIGGKLTDAERDIIEQGGFFPSRGEFNPATDNQLSTYGYLKTIEDGVMVKEAVFHVFAKQITKCDYIPIKGNLTLKQYIAVYQMCINAGTLYLKCEKANKWPQFGYRNGCRDMYAQLCSYHILCFPEAHSKEEHQEGKLIQEESVS